MNCTCENQPGAYRQDGSCCPPQGLKREEPAPEQPFYGIGIGHLLGLPQPAQAPVLRMGSQFYNDLYLGILIRDELSQGGCWQRKDQPVFGISFSLALLQHAGGIHRLLTEWIPEKGSQLSKKWGLE